MVKRTERAKLISKIETLIREKKIREVGNICQFCGGNSRLGLFHILSKGAYPRIRLHEENMLISCWMPCHYKFHHDPYYARDIIFPKIKHLCGDDYEQKLLDLSRTAEKLNMVKLNELYEYYKGICLS